MLHRGVIDTAELDMLLRAQDVMPFWRDRLTAIAYRPLTRVDVRRMYKQGVLNVIKTKDMMMRTQNVWQSLLSDKPLRHCQSLPQAI